MRSVVLTLAACLLALEGCATERSSSNATTTSEKFGAKKRHSPKAAGKKTRAGPGARHKTAVPKSMVKKKRKSRASADSSDVPETYEPRKKACEQYEPLIRKTAIKYGLEPELVLGIVKIESNFNPECRSRVGATGLMQVMPRTGKQMECGSDLEDPKTNVECGCKILKRYLDLYDGNVIYGLAAYNAGPGNASPYARESRLPSNFDYVEKVLRWRNVFVRFGCR